MHLPGQNALEEVIADPSDGFDVIIRHTFLQDIGHLGMTMSIIYRLTVTRKKLRTSGSLR